MLKEAQRMRKDELEKLVPYLENPVESTVFVISWKGRGVDGRSKVSKALKKGTVFESKKMYENQVAPWISEYLREKGYEADPQVIPVIVAYLGANIGLIASELEKIFIYLQSRTDKKITKEVVFEMINVDKDFNVFELMNAIGVRDHVKSHTIINQMMKNVKDNPPILILSQLFNFFSGVQ